MTTHKGMAGRFLISFLLFTVLLSIATSQVEFKEGTQFSMTCDAQTAEVASSFGLILSITLSLVESDGNIKQMARIQQLNGLIGSVSEKEEEFTQKRWSFTQPSMTDLSNTLTSSDVNRNTMKIVATKNPAACSDGGVYKCDVQYLDGITEKGVDKDTNYTGVGSVRVEQIRLSPDDPDNEYERNTTVTVKCIAVGPEDFIFTWKRRCPPPSFVAWPVQNEIQDATKVMELTTGGQPKDCNTYRHTQEVVFITKNDFDGCDLICDFGERGDFTKEASGNLTIKITDGNPPTGPNTSSSASGDSLAIGLGVGLSLLAIIVIIILVYIFCFRKRNKEQKDDNAQDNPDKKNADAYAPPPVFYTKPHKPPKTEKNDIAKDGTGMTNLALDTSYDSKDSANRIPPRYANSPDGNGPPYYNTDDNEPHRRRTSDDEGQENRGYSVDPDPNSDGGRKHRRHDRSKRGDRHNSSRDYDEEPRAANDYQPQPRTNDYEPEPHANVYEPEPRAYDYDKYPRSRNYSTEDKTDFGDPSMGTAI